jgi:hypothetical protein
MIFCIAHGVFHSFLAWKKDEWANGTGIMVSLEGVQCGVSCVHNLAWQQDYLLFISANQAQHIICFERSCGHLNVIGS